MNNLTEIESIDKEIKAYMKTSESYLLILTIILIISLLGNIYLLSHQDDVRRTQGLWLHNYNKTELEEVTQGKEKYGDWICINIDGMSFERMQTVIQHEMAHEIFAERCETNISDCFERLK